MNREQALEQVLNEIPKEALVVVSNGKLGRELFELRKKRSEPTDDFYMLGSMGCALPIALGVAMNTTKPVYCLLGDGNLLMKLGSVATYLKYKPQNLYVVVFNNNVHDSTGGQPTSFEAIKTHIPLRIIEIEPGSRPDLGRQTLTPRQIKVGFMKKLKK